MIKNHPVLGESTLTEVQHPLLESIGDVSSVLTSLRTERLFLVLDETAYEASGAKDVLEPFLKQKAVERFTDFELKPEVRGCPARH